MSESRKGMLADRPARGGYADKAKYWGNIFDLAWQLPRDRNGLKGIAQLALSDLKELEEVFDMSLGGGAFVDFEGSCKLLLELGESEYREAPFPETVGALKRIGLYLSRAYFLASAKEGTMEIGQACTFLLDGDARVSTVEKVRSRR